MRILNLGSMNLDYVYSVEHIVTGGETISAFSRQEYCGGKGLNQSIALARAGAQVFHAGHIGPEGQSLRVCLHDSNVDVSLVNTVPSPTGHAIIQVDEQGQNSIIVFGGANQTITNTDVDQMLAKFESGDILLLQNETSCRDYAIFAASQKGLLVALNPSPIDSSLINSNVLQYVYWFILNEVEGQSLTGERTPECICKALREKHPKCRVMLTLGSKGSIYYDGTQFITQPAFVVNAVDTTAAGDTFTGYFLAGIAAGLPIAACLERASKASAIAVSKPGASVSIPTQAELNSLDW